MREEDLLQTIIERRTWEDVIYHVVSLEGLNPWNVDIVKLTDSFLKYIETMETMDFRIPAKVVLAAAILLKMKADVLPPFEERGEKYSESSVDDGFEAIRERLSELKLEPPIIRKVKKKVSLGELIDALKKAMKVEEKKERMKRRLGRRIRRDIDFDEVDIEKRISGLMLEIDGLLGKLKSDKIGFSKIVKSWERDEIVERFGPLLHLSHRGKVKTNQKKFFEEIFISKGN